MLRPGGTAPGRWPWTRAGTTAVVSGVRVTRALPCPNVAPREEQAHFFALDPRAVVNVRRSLRNTAESIVGFYHSHPDAAAQPSAADMEYIRLWPETVWLIVPVAAGEPGEPRAWWLDEAAAVARTGGT